MRATGCSGSAEEAYAVLGVSPATPQPELGRAYRSLLRRYHPDTAGESADPVRLHDVRRAYAEVRRAVSPAPRFERARSAADGYRTSGYEATAVLDLLA